MNRFIHLAILTVAILRYSINIKIRQAALPDAATVADFNLRLAMETEQLRLDPGKVAKGVAAILGDEAKGLYYVAEAEGKIAGQVMITYEWSDWRNGNLWWLQSVYVEPSFRAKGVFRALFAHVQRMAEERPEVCGLRLYMHSENTRAKKCYERLGMRQTKYQVFELEF